MGNFPPHSDATGQPDAKAVYHKLLVVTQFKSLLQFAEVNPPMAEKPVDDTTATQDRGLLKSLEVEQFSIPSITFPTPE